jgi:Transcription factor WhiB
MPPWMVDALCTRVAELPWIAEPHDCSGPAIIAMRAVCSACPVRTLCDAYVAGSKVESGFWSGRDRTPGDVITERGDLP